MGCGFINSSTGHDEIAARKGNKKLQTIDCRRKSTVVEDFIHEKVKIISSKPTQKQILFATKKLSAHQFFSGLSQKQLKTICQQMIYVGAREGEYLFMKDDVGSSFFLIENGSVDVELNGQVIRTLTEGDTFGELALIFKCGRTASVVCTGKVNAFLLMKPGLYKKTLQKLKIEELKNKTQLIKNVPLFQFLSNKQRFAIASILQSLVYNSNQIIFREGESSYVMYIVMEGQILIEIPGKQNLILKKNEIFGQSLMRDGRRAGKATAISRSVVAIMNKNDIERAIGTDVNNLLFFNIKKWSLIRSKSFKNYSSSDLNQIIMAFQTIKADNNEILNRQTYKGFIISLEGKINGQPEGTLFGEDQKDKQILKKNEAGYFGYLSYSKLYDFNIEIQEKKKGSKPNQTIVRENSSLIELRDFLYVKKLGEGQFGQVFLVKNANLGNSLFAIKCLSKEALIKQQMQDSVIQEKRILQKTIFPYICGYIKSFHDKKSIYLLMEYIHGKELFDVIRQIKIMSEEIIKYFFGCILLSVEYLHSNNVIYRDLKPENSVVDYKGKVYLIDMGTAKQLHADNYFKTFTIIGTPHYMAPQIFQGKGYSFETDYWSLGVLLYEFLCGALPFGDNINADPYAIYSLIKKGTLEFPRFMNNEKAKKAIKGLLIKNPIQRSQSINFDKIKRMEYFSTYNWQNLSQEKTLPPYIPKEFRVLNEINVDKIDTRPFLKFFYKNQKNLTVSDWNEEF